MVDYFPLLEVLLVSLLAAAGQLLLRSSAPRIAFGLGLREFITSLLQPRLVAAAGLVFAAPLLYFHALRSLPLSTAFSVSALSHIWVPAGAALLLKERIGKRRALGIAVIIAGLLLWGIAA